MWDSNWRCKNTKPIVFPHPNATNKHNKRGITIGVAKIQRFGIGARVKVRCGITVGVAKIQSQLFSHTQTQPINTTIKKKSTTINTTIKKTKLKSKKAKVGCGITIGVAKIQSQLFTHAQTRPISTTIKKKSTTINTTIKKTKLKSKKAKAKAKAKEKAKSKKQKEKAKSKKQKAKNQKRGKGKSKSKSKK